MRPGLESRLRKMAHRHALWDVWRDFLLLVATSIANAVDKRESVWREREDEYMRTVKRYSSEEADEFCRLLADLTEELVDPRDVLGQMFMALELGNKWTGQFFTPDSLCQIMAALLIDDAFKEKVERHGFVTVSEPSVGGGATVIGLYRAMIDAKLNPQKQLHVTAVDVDIKSVHMAYIQLSLLHVPAVIIHGNSLSLGEWSRWYTPAHILGGWGRKLQPREEAQQDVVLEPMQPDLFDGSEERGQAA